MFCFLFCFPVVILQVATCSLDHPAAVVCVVQSADKPVLWGALRLYFSVPCSFTNSIPCRFFSSIYWMTLLSHFWTNITVVDIFISSRLVGNFSTSRKSCNCGNVSLDRDKSFYITINLVLWMPVRKTPLLLLDVAFCQQLFLHTRKCHC